MNYKLLLLAMVTAGITSCSTAYKAGQTPDDVYYSPAKEIVAKKETTRERQEDYVRNEEDQYLRMKVRNRDRWSRIDDYDYWYDSRYDHCLCNYNSYNQYAWNNWNMGYTRPMWGGFYYNNFNPGFGYGGWHPGFGYGGYPVVINKQFVPKASNVNRPRLGGYNNAGYNNNNNNLGSSIRKVFTPGSNSSYNNSNSGSNRNANSGTYNNSTPSRTYSPSSSSSSSSGARPSSGSSGGGVSRPARGGN